MKIKSLILALLFPLVSFGANTNIIDNAVIKNLTVTNSAITYVGIITSNTINTTLFHHVRNFSPGTLAAAAIRFQNDSAGLSEFGIANTNGTTGASILPNYAYSRGGSSASGFQYQLASSLTPFVWQYGVPTAVIPSMTLSRLAGPTRLGIGLWPGTNAAATVHLGVAEEIGAFVSTNELRFLIEGGPTMNNNFLLFRGGQRGLGVTNLTVNHFGILEATTNVIIRGQGAVASGNTSLATLLQGVHATYGGAATNITWPIPFSTIPFIGHAVTTDGGTAAANDTFFATNITLTGCTIGFRTSAGATSAATITVDVNAHGTQ